MISNQATGVSRRKICRAYVSILESITRFVFVKMNVLKWSVLCLYGLRSLQTNSSCEYHTPALIFYAYIFAGNFRALARERHQRNRVSSKKAWLARFSLATVACLYGTEYAAIKVMGGLLGTSTLLALRFTLASVTLLPALSNIKAKVLMDGAEVGMYATLGYWAQAGALQVLVIIL